MTPILATIDPWILTFSAVTVIATIWMGFWAARRSKTASDFFVAGRSVSVGWNASAISGEYLSAASFMGVAGMVMSVGYDALWYPVCYACGYLFLLLFIAGPLRRFGAYTVPDLAEGRFDSPLFRKIAVVFVLFIGFFYTMPQMKGAGTTLAYIFPGLPYWAGVVLVGAVITLNVALGGMKGITLVQAFQYWAKMFAISVPIFVLMAVYGHYGKQLGSPNEILKASQEPWDKVFLRIADDEERPYYLNGFWHVTMLRLGLWGTTASRTPRQWTVEQMATEYANCRAAFGRKTVYIEHSIVSNNIVYPGVAKNTLRESIRVVGGTLRSNGIVIQEVADRTFKFFSQTNASRLAATTVPEQQENVARQPLPEKAPADSTWLSPFGPLTTKAAKAAAASMTNDPSGIPLAPSHNPHHQFRLNYAVSNVSQVLNVYGNLSGREFVAGSGAYQLSEATLSNRLASSSINRIYHPVLSRTKEDVRRLIEICFGEAGITLVPVENSKFSAVETEKLAAYWNEARKVWMDKTGKPLSLLYTYSLIIALVCGTAGLPHILVRFYTNPDGVAAKRTTMWVMILIGIFYVFPPVFGVMGRNLLPELYAATGAKGTDKIVLELPRLLNEKYAPLGSILSGITCAGAFAAFMSTFSGLLVSMTGAMAHDVYGRMLNPKATGEQRLRAFKIAAVGVGGVAIILGTFVEPLQINFMVGQAFAIAAASYFPLLFMCAWWRNLTMKGAATGMLTGGLAAVFAISLTSFSDLAMATDKTAEFFAVFKPLNEFWSGHPLLRILCEQPAIWAVPLAIGLMVVVSKLTRREVPKDIRMKMLVLHAPEKLGLKQEYIQEHQHH